MHAWRRTAAAAAALLGAAGLSLGLVSPAGASSGSQRRSPAPVASTTRAAGARSLGTGGGEAAPPAASSAPSTPATDVGRTADPGRRQQPVGSLPGEPNRALTIIGGVAAVVIVAAGGLAFRWFARRGERSAAAPAAVDAGRAPDDHLP